MFNNVNIDREMLDKLQMMHMGFSSYENEFETMKLSVNNQLAVGSAQVAWNSLNISNNNTSLRTSESIHLREQGNKLFKDSPEQNALDACRLYTKSLLVAPLGSEALALAHANRAAALQKFGYFQQALDDCECALEQGYPINLRYKIIARQAACAAKLGDATLLQKHLGALTVLSLNENYKTLVEQLQQSLEELHHNGNNMEKNEENVKEFRGPLKIVKTKSKGRCLVADKPIKKDELIFTERASSFVPVTERHVCQNCAATQLIPFPCYSCYGKVVYCSLKCRVAHQAIHAYECLAYQRGLFYRKPDHLALRIMLDGIQEIISFLNKKRSSEEIWSELTCESSTLLQSDLKYVQSLRMMTHLEKKSASDILRMANEAFLMAWYLRNQTNFFNLFKKTKASLKDWHLVIASLLLRHMGQLRTNGNTMAVLTIKITDPYDSTLLFTKLWQSAFHVRLGFLHMFCTYEDVIYANFPYFSLFNHACSSSMVTKRNGRYLSARAVNNIEAGNEIFNSYILRISERQLKRQSYLMETFNFKCKCGKCSKENPDEGYEKYHRFLCENPTCRQIFISDIPLGQILILFRLSGLSDLSCTECHANQYGLIQALNGLSLLNITKSNHESEFTIWINIFKSLNKWLKDPHYIKFDLSTRLVKEYFAVCNADSPTHFSNTIVSEMIEILKYQLQCLIEHFDITSVDYIGPMTYLWDFIALGQYRCGADEMKKMLQAIEVLPDETKKLFINYYNDYIVESIIP